MAEISIDQGHAEIERITAQNLLRELITRAYVCPPLRPLMKAVMQGGVDYTHHVVFLAIDPDLPFLASVAQRRAGMLSDIVRDMLGDSRWVVGIMAATVEDPVIPVPSDWVVIDRERLN